MSVLKARPIANRSRPDCDKMQIGAMFSNGEIALAFRLMSEHGVRKFSHLYSLAVLALCLLDVPSQRVAIVRCRDQDLDRDEVRVQTAFWMHPNLFNLWNERRPFVQTVSGAEYCRAALFYLSSLDAPAVLALRERLAEIELGIA
jgi:hypothetical protein